MTRKSGIALSWLLLSAFLATAGLADAKADKEPSLKDLMATLNAEKTGLRVEIDKGIKEDKPDWTAVQKMTKQYLDGASALPQKDPPKGEKESWAKLSKEFVVAAKNLDEAANSMDRKMCQEAFTKMMMGCRGCHTQHRIVKSK